MKGQILVPILFFMCIGCTHDPALRTIPSGNNTTCATPAPNFNADIQPIFKHTCAKVGCHDGDNMPHDFSVYNELLIILRDSALYYYVIKDRTMPQDTPLTISEYRKVQCWLAAGYPER